MNSWENRRTILITHESLHDNFSSVRLQILEKYERRNFELEESFSTFSPQKWVCLMENAK